MATVSERSYRVVVTREDDHWLADVAALLGVSPQRVSQLTATAS